MSGVSADDISSDDQSIIRTSLAEGCKHLSSNDITIMSVTDVARRRLRLANRHLLSSSVEVEYETSVSLESTSFLSAATLFSNISTTVESYITSGELQTALQDSGSDSLSSVDVDEADFSSPISYIVVITSTTSPTTSPTAEPTIPERTELPTPSPTPAAVKFTIEGAVEDAAYSTSIKGAHAKLRYGTDITKGAVSFECDSDNDGAISLSLEEAGSYTLEVNKDGYLDTFTNLIVTEEGTQILVSMAPELDDDEMLITMSWGSQESYTKWNNGRGTPTDLDLYLQFAVSDSSDCLVYHGREQCGGAKLMATDTIPMPTSAGSISAEQANGVEVISISPVYETQYALFVRNTGQDQPFETSNLVANFYSSDGLIKTVTLPPRSTRENGGSWTYRDTPLSGQNFGTSNNVENSEYLRLACIDHTSGGSSPILHECQR